MMSQKLGFLSSVLCKWHAQATLIGKSVLPVLLLIRLVILGAAVHTVWSDDEETFECYALQPGCQTACFDARTPLSLPRLWTLQLVLVLAPGLVFLCYLIYLTNQETQVQKKNGEVKGHTRTVYLACTVFVILVEVGCNVVQWLLYGFQLSTEFACMRDPCPHTVDCFVPHAREKTVLLHIMLTASSLSILLNAVEAVCAKLRRPDGGKTLQCASVVEESILSRLLALWHSHAGFLGTVKKNQVTQKGRSSDIKQLLALKDHDGELRWEQQAKQSLQVNAVELSLPVNTQITNEAFDASNRVSFFKE